ncbi:hypothetical protein [Bacillus cabrialesii]|uniref:Uncharacterized protein n=1 Tax=Bacillus cabrialesii subsp. tritici TaxID=2944916 RepID=A0ABT9DJ97_9BACI|nr:hypothetical protein [Bacillus cabrialesii]MDO8224765.1 hypothetical protein [Bacillus cabrialesii subsp. tritici]
MEFHQKSLKKVFDEIEKKAFGTAGLSKKIVIVCMTFKKSFKLKKNRFFTFFLFLNSAVKMPSCPTLWYDAQ